MRQVCYVLSGVVSVVCELNRDGYVNVEEDCLG